MDQPPGLTRASATSPTPGLAARLGSARGLFAMRMERKGPGRVAQQFHRDVAADRQGIPPDLVLVRRHDVHHSVDDDEALDQLWFWNPAVHHVVKVVDGVAHLVVFNFINVDEIAGIYGDRANVRSVSMRRE
jgi:hypothetical protein